MEYETLKLSYKDKIGIITFNRPDKLNAMSQKFFAELLSATKEMDDNDDVVVVIIKGEGKAFSSGLDFYDFLQNFKNNKQGKTDEEFLNENVIFMQDSISSIENSKKIYIAAVHGYCVGGGLDLASTCDMRVASQDAVFSILETQIGVVADLGSIQRLPRIIGEGNVRLLAYTSMKIDAKKALSIGLVNEIYKDKDEMLNGAFEIAREIISKPKKAVLGTKTALNYGLTHSTEESLRFAARFNANLFDYDTVKNRFLSNVKK